MIDNIILAKNSDDLVNFNVKRDTCCSSGSYFAINAFISFRLWNDILVIAKWVYSLTTHYITHVPRHILR